MDKELRHFFKVIDENSMKELSFYRSDEARPWFRELRCAAKNVTVDQWRIYALDVVDELEKAIVNDEVRNITDIFLNVFHNQMNLTLNSI